MTDRRNRRKLGTGGMKKCVHCGSWHYARTKPRKDEVRPTEAASMLGISYSRVHQLIEAGRLAARRDGRNRFVKLDSVLNRMAVQQNSTARQRARHDADWQFRDAFDMSNG